MSLLELAGLAVLSGGVVERGGHSARGLVDSPPGAAARASLHEQPAVDQEPEHGDQQPDEEAGDPRGESHDCVLCLERAVV